MDAKNENKLQQLKKTRNTCAEQNAQGVETRTRLHNSPKRLLLGQ